MRIHFISILIISLSFILSSCSLHIDFQPIMLVNVSSSQNNHLFINETNTIVIIAQSQLILYDLSTLKIILTVFAEGINHNTNVNYMLSENNSSLFLVFVDNQSKVKYIKLFTIIQSPNNALTILPMKIPFVEELIFNVPNQNQSINFMLESPSITRFQHPNPSLPMRDMLHLVVYNNDESTIKRVCDLIVLQGQFMMKCDQPIKQYIIQKPSHFIKIGLFKYAILTNNQFVLIFGGYQDNKLVDLFKDKKVTNVIDEKIRTSCRIDVFGLAQYNQQQYYQNENANPINDDKLIVALYRCANNKFYLMEYSIQEDRMVEFSQKFSIEKNRNNGRILEPGNQDHPNNPQNPFSNDPGNKNDKNYWKFDWMIIFLSTLNQSLAITTTKTGKQGHFPIPGSHENEPPKPPEPPHPQDKQHEYNEETNDIHVSVLQYSNQLVVQSGNQVQILQLGRQSNEKDILILPFESNSLKLHFFDTSLADTQSRYLPFAIAAEQQSIGLLSALCSHKDEIYYSYQQQCISMECEKNMLVQYEPQLRQPICLNYQTNSKDGVRQFRLIGLILIISVIGIGLVAWKKWQKKDILMNLEDPRVLIEVEMKEQEQQQKEQEQENKSEIDREIVEEKDVQLVQMESQIEQLIVGENSNVQNQQQQQQQQQDETNNQDNTMKLHKQINSQSSNNLNSSYSSTPTPQFDIEQQQQLQHKKQLNSQQNEQDQMIIQPQQLYQNLKGSYYNQQQTNNYYQTPLFSYGEQQTQKNVQEYVKYSEQQQLLQSDIPPQGSSSQSKHNPFQNNQEQNQVKSQIATMIQSMDSSSQNSQSLISSLNRKQQFSRLLECSYIVMEQQKKSQINNSIQEIDQNALIAFEDALKDYVDSSNSSSSKLQNIIIQQQENQPLQNPNENDGQQIYGSDESQKQISDFEIALAEDLAFQNSSKFNPFQLAESIIKRASQHEEQGFNMIKQKESQKQLKKESQGISQIQENNMNIKQEVNIDEINQDNDINIKSNLVKKEEFDQNNEGDQEIQGILSEQQVIKNEEEIIIQSIEQPQNLEINENKMNIQIQSNNNNVGHTQKKKRKYPDLNKPKEENIEQNIIQANIPESTETECPICQSNPKNCTLYKCGHRLCVKCAREIQSDALTKTQTTPSCPICRTEILDIVVNFG